MFMFCASQSSEMLERKKTPLEHKHRAAQGKKKPVQIVLQRGKQMMHMLKITFQSPNKGKFS